MAEITFSVLGMYADHHVVAVVGTLKGLAGVNGVVASSLRKKVTVAYDPAGTFPEKLQQALEAAGYAAEKAEGVLHEEDLDIRRTD